MIAVTAVIVILLATGIHNVGTDLVVHFNNRGGPIGKSIRRLQKYCGRMVMEILLNRLRDALMKLRLSLL